MDAILESLVLDFSMSLQWFANLPVFAFSTWDWAPRVSRDCTGKGSPFCSQTLHFVADVTAAILKMNCRSYDRVICICRFSLPCSAIGRWVTVRWQCGPLDYYLCWLLKWLSCFPSVILCKYANDVAILENLPQFIASTCGSVRIILLPI